MCGIALTLFHRGPGDHCCCDCCAQCSSSSYHRQEGDCSSNNSSPPFSSCWWKQKLSDSLARRGRDQPTQMCNFHFWHKTREGSSHMIKNAEWDMSIMASVLHLQGAQMTCQPMIRHYGICKWRLDGGDGRYKNHNVQGLNTKNDNCGTENSSAPDCNCGGGVLSLCWNGECYHYDRENDQEDADNEESEESKTSNKASHHGNNDSLHQLNQNSTFSTIPATFPTKSNIMNYTTDSMCSNEQKHKSNTKTLKEKREKQSDTDFVMNLLMNAVQETMHTINDDNASSLYTYGESTCAVANTATAESTLTSRANGNVSISNNDDGDGGGVNIIGNDYNTNKNSYQQEEHMAIANALSGIRGEYSFILYHRQHRHQFTLSQKPPCCCCKHHLYNQPEQDKFCCSNDSSTAAAAAASNDGCIYYGRDPLGRRSLIQITTPPNVEEGPIGGGGEECDGEDRRCGFDSFMITSVVPPIDYYSQQHWQQRQCQQRDGEGEEAVTQDVMSCFTEIPPGIVYCLNLKTMSITSINIPKCPYNENIGNMSNSSIFLKSTVRRATDQGEEEQKETKQTEMFVQKESCSISGTNYSPGSLYSTVSSSMEAAALQLYSVLSKAVQRRVVDVPLTSPSTPKILVPTSPSTFLNTHPEGRNDCLFNADHDERSSNPLKCSEDDLWWRQDASIAVLFSGGLDSVVLTKLAHECIPVNQPIDLVNVTFATTERKSGDRCISTSSSQQQYIHLNASSMEPHKSCRILSSPDRLAAIESFHELHSICPYRQWRLIIVDVSLDQVQKYERHICSLIKPCAISHMNFNIGAALWFASRGKGRAIGFNNNDDVTKNGEEHRIKDEFGVTACYPKAMITSLKTGQKQKFSKKKVNNYNGATCSFSPCKNRVANVCVFHACNLCCCRYHRPIKKVVGGSAQICDAHWTGDQAGSSTKSGDGDNAAIPDIVHFNLHGLAISSGNITTKAKVLLMGFGADELMAGYHRHRTVYRRGGYDLLRIELNMEVDRMWIRNLGRDDRCLSDHNREVRYPFLDEDFVSFIKSCDLRDVCDLSLPSGVGDKMLLRMLARMLGLHHCSTAAKRAIQFGSRIAKLSKVSQLEAGKQASGSAIYCVKNACT